MDAQIIYASAALEPLDDDALKRLLASARQFNASQDVSGILLYQAGSFLQVLEGSEPALDVVYGRVSADKRHGRISLLHRSLIAERQFADWSMGWVAAERAMKKVPGLNDFFARGVDGLRGDSRWFGVYSTASATADIAN